jgi:hypothetical protein
MFKVLIMPVPGQAVAAGEEVADIETRAVAAVQARRDASVAARALFAGEIAKLKGRVRQPQKPMAG